MRKHIKIFDSWKSPGFKETDEQNKEEIESLLKEMGDELDDFKYNVVVDEMLDECYNIKYSIQHNTLSFKTKKYDLENGLSKNLNNLKVLNEYISLSHELMKRLDSLGYSIGYFQTEHGFDQRTDTPILWTNIRILRNDNRVSA